MSQNSFIKHNVLFIRCVTSNIFLMRIDRQDKKFIAGQHITIHMPEIKIIRDYSIYSTENNPFFDIVIKDGGGDAVAKLLKEHGKNVHIECNDPHGNIVLRKGAIKNQRHYFIATGTGIVPFHAIIKTNPDLNYDIVHGVSYKKDVFDDDEYDKNRYHLCISREPGGDFDGSVTEYLKQNPVTPKTYCYISGNPEMALEVYHLLISQGIPFDHIFSDQI